MWQWGCERWIQECPLSLAEIRSVDIETQNLVSFWGCLLASPLNAVFLRVLTSVLFYLDTFIHTHGHLDFHHCPIHFQSNLQGSLPTRSSNISCPELNSFLNDAPHVFLVSLSSFIEPFKLETRNHLRFFSLDFTFTFILCHQVLLVLSLEYVLNLSPCF